MEIYERIRILRKNHLKLSQEEFGKRLGVTRSVIKNIELNVLARPDQKEPIYKLICREFGVNELWLRTGEGELFADFSEEEEIGSYLTDLIDENSDIGTKTLKSAIIAYGRLDDGSKKVICDYLESLYKILNKDMDLVEELKRTIP